MDPAISGQLAALLGIEVAQTDAMLLGLQAVAQATREPLPPRGLVGRRCTYLSDPRSYGGPIDPIERIGTIRHVMPDDAVLIEATDGRIVRRFAVAVELLPWEPAP